MVEIIFSKIDSVILMFIPFIEITPEDIDRVFDAMKGDLIKEVC